MNHNGKIISTKEEELMSILWVMLKENVDSDEVHEKGRWRVHHRHRAPKNPYEGVEVEDLKIHVQKTNIREDELTVFLDNLEKFDFIERINGKIRFTDLGYKLAENLVRRQRLAERLFADILDIKDEEVLREACKFEHVISRDVEEAICTLLGHPTECPHGKPIPPGDCCIKVKTKIESILKPASQLKIGQKGVIKYMTAKDNRTMHKLISMGLLPGIIIKMHQKMPGNGPLIIQIDETQIAFEQSVAEKLMVQPLP
ncbi:MAG: metal-dependent transcriptional regulator [Candidatus Helarchaeota archaeon]